VVEDLQAEPDAFCWEVFRALETELSCESKDESKTKRESKVSKNGRVASKADGPDQRMLWSTVRELFEYEVEWNAKSVDGGDFNDSSTLAGPVFTFVVRGFSTLEMTLDHYFSPRTIEDGSGVRVRTNRRFRRLPLILQWYLKRGDYDCCTGLCGLTDTYLGFPRQLDMGKYCEGAGIYLLYGVMVEADEHYWSYIRPEMEGDQGQWYRFDDHESSTCAMSNATAIDASFGGEEWLCVNYLYGPSAVLTRPKESRACLLVYLKESHVDVLLQEPRPPKNSREFHSASTQREVPTRVVEAEAAAAAAQALLEEVEAQAMKEERKRKQKQKKKQKDKVKRSQLRKESALSDSPCEERKSDSKDISPLREMATDFVCEETPNEGSEDAWLSPTPSKAQQEVLAALDKRLGVGLQRREFSDSDGSKGFEEHQRPRMRRRPKGATKPDPKVHTSDPPSSEPARASRAPPVVPDRGDRCGGAGAENGPRVNCHAPWSSGSSAPVGDHVNGVEADAKPAKWREFAHHHELPRTAIDPGCGASRSAPPRVTGVGVTGGSTSSRAVAGAVYPGTVHEPIGEFAPGGSTSSRAGAGVAVFPEQLVTPDGALGEYAQFVCRICNLVVRSPLVLPCAHLFCSGCFSQWAQERRPHVECPTCSQQVKRQQLVHFESSSTPGGALGLLYRLYSGMKVRCVYDSELARPLTAEAGRARAQGLSCTWRGALHDYPNHLGSCPAHSSTKPDLEGSAQASIPAKEGLSCAAQPHVTGAFQALAPWHSPEVGALSIQRGASLWVSSTDESGEWAYARLGDAHAWVPRAVLQRAVYPARSTFDAHGQAQGLSLSPGDHVQVYHRETSGWTYGARLALEGSPEQVGWFPEACIADPLPTT